MPAASNTTSTVRRRGDQTRKWTPRPSGSASAPIGSLRSWVGRGMALTGRSGDHRPVLAGLAAAAADLLAQRLQLRGRRGVPGLFADDSPQERQRPAEQRESLAAPEDTHRLLVVAGVDQRLPDVLDARGGEGEGDLLPVVVEQQQQRLAHDRLAALVDQIGRASGRERVWIAGG